MSCQITAPIHYITFNLLNLNSGNLLNFFHLKFIAVAVYFAFLGRIHKSDMIKGEHTHTHSPLPSLWTQPTNTTPKKGVCRIECYIGFISFWLSFSQFAIFFLSFRSNPAFFPYLWRLCAAFPSILSLSFRPWNSVKCPPLMMHLLSI